MVEYLLMIGRHWPADMLISGYASVLRIVELPFQIRTYTLRRRRQSWTDSLPGCTRSGSAFLSRVSGIGLAISAFAVVTVASWSVRAGIWFLIALLYFAGYPAVQFDTRHFFFLEFIPWLALGLTCEGALAVLAAAKKIRAGEVFGSDLMIRGRRALAFGIGAVLALGVPVVVLRAYQQKHVTTLLESYLATATETLTLSRTPLGEQRILLRPNELEQSIESDRRAEYLVVDVTRSHCARPLAPITFRYETTNGYTDLTERVYVPVPPDDAPFRLFFPAYYSPGQHFVGVEVMEGDAGCIASVRRIVDTDRSPMWLDLTLPPDWRQMKLYQTLTAWERPSAPYRIRVYAWPRTLDPARLALSGMAPPPVSSLSHSVLVASDTAERWVIRGTVWSPTSFLARLPERPVSKGASFVVRGTLYRGGFTVGLLKNDLWTTSVNVVVPGEFLAVVEAPEDGRYIPALANYLTGMSWRNDLVVTTAGWEDSYRSARLVGGQSQLPVTEREVNAGHDQD